MAKGSNELNMLLKSQVVKVRVELDIPKSMPKIKKQVKEISAKLIKNPIKLQVKLDYKLGELRGQLKTLETSLRNSKSSKPIKLHVQIDVAGSAKTIKAQLRDVYKTVEDFNRKYGEQIKKMNQQTNMVAQGSKKVMSAPTNAPVGGFDLKLYAQQVKDAKAMMKGMFGKGTFTSFETKNAQGALTGFIGQLEKANGVVQKIKYQWDSNAGKFTPINQQTVNSTEKHVHKATQSLRGLQAEMEKLGKGTGKNNLFKDYADLEKRIGHGTLTQDAVKNLQQRIKEEQVLQGQIKKENDLLFQQKKLLQDIKKSSMSIKDASKRNDYKPLLTDTRNAQSVEELRNIRLENEKLTASIKRQETSNKETMQTLKEKLRLSRELKQLEKTVSTKGNVPEAYMRETRALIDTIRSTKDLERARARLATIKDGKWSDGMEVKVANTTRKIEEKLRRLVDVGGITQSSFNRQMAQIPLNARKSFGDLERQLDGLTVKMRQKEAEMRRSANNTKVILDSTNKSVGNKAMIGNFKSAVNTGDIAELQKYIGQLYKGKVETVKMENTTDALGRAVTQLKVKMAGTGKTVQTFALQMDRANGTLRQVSQGIDYNANRNLGVFEQLKIAMARVPVWMGAMTAFYGTIRSVRAMSSEILKVDASLTELKRVASDNINIEYIFKGSVGLAKELGNNIHDIMQSMNDYSRTFGNFNERQLLAITRTTTLMSNVSELTATEATESLIGTMNAFNITAEESIRIVDVFNEVDNNFAVSTKQLAEGMQKGASTAKTFGVSLEESVGHITAISSVTMESGRIIGNSLKTIYSRITTMEGAQDILESVGVAIYQIGENGEEVVKPVSKILEDLAGKWHLLTDSERQNIAVKVAGRYQLSRFLALMNNWQTAVDATRTALTSEGSAMKENNKYMESFEARINKLKNTFTEMSLAIGDSFLSGAIFAAIEGLASLAKMATTVSGSIGALPVVFFVIGTILGLMGTFKGSVGSTIVMLKLMGAEFMKTSITATGFAGAMARTGASLRALTVLLPGIAAGFRAIGAAMKSVLISTGIGILFVGVGIAIEKLIGHFQKQKKISEETEKANKKLVDSYRNTAGGLSELVDTYSDLQIKVDSGQIKEGTEAYNDYLVVNQEIAKQMPTMVKFTDSKGVAHMQTADAMREEVKAAGELSKVYAELTLEEFKSDTSERMKAIGELVKEIDKLDKKQKKLKKDDGKTKTVYYGQGQSQAVTTDNGAKIQQNRIESIKAEQEIQKEVQKTSLMIRDTVLSSLESSEKLKYMTDTQMGAVEALIQNNEKFLKEITDNRDLSEAQMTEQLNARIDELFSIGESVGVMLADKSKEMTSGLIDKEEIAEVKTGFDNLLKSLPTSFFNLESLDNVDDFKGRLQGVIDVADQVKGGNGNFEGLENQLQRMGFGADEAKRTVAQLGFQYDNQAIKTETLKQASEGLTGELGDFIDVAFEATDASRNLFGYDSTITGALASHVETLQGLKLIYKDNYSEMDVWKESIEAVSIQLGVGEEQVEKNLGHYKNMFDLIPKLTLKYNDAGVAIGIETKELSKSEKAVWQKIKAKGEEGMMYDLVTGQTFDLNAATEESTKVEKDNAKAVVESKDAKIQQSDALSLLSEKFADLKANMSETNKSDYINTVSEQLADLKGRVITTKDEAGNLRLVMADGSKSGYLSALETQLDNLGLSLGIVKDENDDLKLHFNDATGSTSLTVFNEQADSTKLAIDDTIKSVDLLNDKKVLPNDYSQIDFTLLAEGLDTTTQKVQLLSEGLQGVGENTSSISLIQSALESLKTHADNIKASIKAVLDGTKGDLEDLSSKAKEAKESIDALKTAIGKIKENTKTINLGGFEVLKKDVDNVKKALGKLEKAFEKVPASARDMASQVGESVKGNKKKIEEQTDAVKQLGEAYLGSEKDISSAFKKMSKKVTANSNNMTNSHKTQKSAIEKLADAARIAKTAIESLNTVVAGAMMSLDRYITKASSASTAGKNVPKANSFDTGGGLFGSKSVNAPSEGVLSAMSTFSASAGDSTGGIAGGDSGTSGIIQSSIYDNNGEDGFFSSLAKKAIVKKSTTKKTTDKTARKQADRVEPLADLYDVDLLGRQEAAITSMINTLKAKMEGLNANGKEYRDMLRDILKYENAHYKIISQQLKTLDARNKVLEGRIKKLSNVTKHTKEQRDEYNKLQTEYDSNLGKIATLKTEVVKAAIDMKKSVQDVFGDLVDEMVAAMDGSLSAINERIGVIDFKLEVFDLTEPDNVSKKIELLTEKTVEYVRERSQYRKLRADLEAQLERATKNFGANSDAVKKVADQLKVLDGQLRTVTLSILKTEKEISDARGAVADKIIDKMKDNYKEEAKMAEENATKLIDTTKKAQEEQSKIMKKAHDEQLDVAKKAHEAQIKLYDAEIKKINDVYDAKVKSLDDESSQSDYNEELANKTQNITDLSAKKALLNNDKSLEGKKRYADIDKELRDAELELDKFMKNRHKDLLKDQLQLEKDSQIESIENTKEHEKEKFDIAIEALEAELNAKFEALEAEHAAKIEALEKEKEATAKHYEDISANEAKWAKIRGDLIKGNFKDVKTELESMGVTLTQLSNGTFDTLSEGFAKYSQEVRDFVTEINSMISNINTMPNLPSQGGSLGNGSDDDMIKFVTPSNLPKIIAKAKSGIAMDDPTPDKNRVYDAVKNTNLSEAELTEILNKAKQGKTLVKPTAEKQRFFDMFMEIFGKKIDSFDTGGYTGDWSGNDGKLAMVHKKEIMLKEDDTSNLLDALKLLDRIKRFTPSFNTPSAAKLASQTSSIVATNTYNLTVNIDNLNGNKDGGNTVVKEIVNGLKKLGR